MQCTKDEQRDAMIDQRTQLCKNFEFGERKTKALSRQSQRLKANEEAERVRLATMKAEEERRQIEY